MNTINSKVGRTSHTEPLTHDLQTLHLPRDLNLLQLTEFLARFVQFVHLYRSFNGHTQAGEGGSLQPPSHRPHTEHLAAPGLWDLDRVRVVALQTRLVQQLDVFLFTCKQSRPPYRERKQSRPPYSEQSRR